MKKLHISSVLLGLALAFSGCNPAVDEPSFNKGTIDVSRYVALGDFYTAGYSNGGVSPETQQYSYPAILAQQFAMVGGTQTFVQPLFAPGTGTGTLKLSGFRPSDNLPVIVQDVSNRQVISGPFAPDPCQAVDTVYQYPRFTGNLGDIQNFGMPGLKLAQVTKTGTGNVANIGTADFNPYYERILPANTNDSYLTTVSRANGTFYTVWFGVSEMLPHILSGASCSQPLPNAAAIRGALTPVLDTLVKNNAKIAIGNIPDLTSFGLTRIADPIVLQNSFRQQLNNNNLNIWVQSSPSYQARRIDSRDILLPQAVYSIGTNGYGLDSLNPVVKEQVIDQIESGKINNYIRDYNGVVNALATGTRYSFSTIDRFKDNLILVDLNSLFKVLADRVAYNGVQYNADFVNGGVFSLDGFTLTPRGQAIVANEFIRSINKAYDPSNTAGGFGANIPRVNVNQYPGVVYP